jgi:hypothetical protein
VRYRSPVTSERSATITVSRPPSDELGQRPILLFLDSERWTSLRHGQSAALEIPAGSHSIRADNTLFRKTIAFEVRPGEQARFVVSNRAGFGTSLFMVLGSPLFYLTLARE